MKKFIHIVGMLALFMSLASFVHAETVEMVRINGGEPVKFIDGENVELCLGYDRNLHTIWHIPKIECDGDRKLYARLATENEQRLAREQADSEAFQKRQDELQTKRDVAAAEQKKAQEKAQEEFLAKRADEDATRKKVELAWRRQEREAQRARDTKIAALKEYCGVDYKNPTIGMKLDRVKECVAPVKLVSQINREDGVVSTYQYGSLFIHTMSGNVVAWER